MAKQDTLKQRTIHSNYLKIYGNCMEIEETSIQLSNVSHVTISDLASPSFPWMILFLVFGGWFLITERSPIGWVVLLAGIIWFFIWAAKKKESEESKYLTIVTNSGHVLPIVFKNKAFAGRVLDVIKNIMAYPEREASLTVDIQNCHFTEGATAIGTINEKRK